MTYLFVFVGGRGNIKIRNFKRTLTFPEIGDGFVHCEFDMAQKVLASTSLW